MLTEIFDVTDDRLSDQLLHLSAGVTCCNAAGEVGHPCAPAAWTLFIDDRVLAHRSSSLNPDWRRTAPSVPGGISALGLPAMATMPALVGWRKMRWLPLCRSKNHPSASSTSITRETFTSVRPYVSLDIDRQRANRPGLAPVRRHQVTHQRHHTDPHRTRPLLSDAPDRHLHRPTIQIISLPLPYRQNTLTTLAHATPRLTHLSLSKKPRNEGRVRCVSCGVPFEFVLSALPVLSVGQLTGQA